MTVTVNGLEEIKALAGRDLGPGEWLEITQERVNAFADATDDHQWIHVDPERAKDGPFGTTIAHGYLTLSLIIPLFSRLLEIKGVRMSINYGLDRVRFPSPVKVGSRIRLAGKVVSGTVSATCGSSSRAAARESGTCPPGCTGTTTRGTPA